MKNDETVKLMAETLKDSLSKYVGEKADERTIKEVKDHMMSVLMSFRNTMDVIAPLPKIEVTVSGCEASFKFFDPKTGEDIAIGSWIARATEGFYE